MAQPLSKLSMNLFGLPYQFPDAVDPRIKELHPKIGKKFTENIIMEAPVCTIIPGEPSFLPGSSKDRKITTAQALLENASGDFSTLKEVLKNNKDDDMRLYDFKNNYTDYMNYVNVLCRAGATFLNLKETIMVNGQSYTYQNYDWKNYRWNTEATTSMVTRTGKATKTLLSGISNFIGGKGFTLSSDEGDDGDLDNLMTNFNYVQFYVDPDISPQESLSNMTMESQVKGLFENGSNMIKDVAFLANSGGIDPELFTDLVGGASARAQEIAGQLLGDNGISSTISRIINLGGSSLQGHNIVIPDIYNSSSYTKSNSITVHLRNPYGTKLGYYLNIFVPMMHLFALALPKQETANSYSSPFLVKCYIDGIYSCDLGIVDQISVNRVMDSLSVSGLPSEVDVSLNITDLYSSISMSPGSSPTQFINNSSLVEFLATNCGLSLTQPNLGVKLSNIINTYTTAVTDVPNTIKSMIDEKISSLLSKLTRLYK